MHRLFSNTLIKCHRNLIKVDAKKFLSANRKCAYSLAPETKSKEISPKNILQLADRGLLNDIDPEVSPNLPRNLTKDRQCFYCGFDPTAESLHVGNLLSLMVLLHCQRSGHDVIAVIGTATARIGDPAGHFTDRKKIPDSEIDRNAQEIAENIRYIFDNHARDVYANRDVKELPNLKVLFNYDWYKDMNPIELISNIFSQYRLKDLQKKRAIQERMKNKDSMPMNEFVYQIIQAYDWLHLHNEYGCNFQVGGEDQLCNIRSGAQIIKKLASSKKETYGLFTPLLTTDKDIKIGKSAGNAVWLDPRKTSPYEFYQYFFRQPDSQVESQLKYFTFIPLKEISRIMQDHKNSPKYRNAQRILAKNVTKIVHGAEGLESAERCTRAFYGGRAEDLERLNDKELNETFNRNNIIHSVLEPDTTIADALTITRDKSLVGGVQQLLADGNVRINNVAVDEDSSQQILLSNVHVLANNVTMVSVTKKRHYIIKWTLPRITSIHDDSDTSFI